MLTLIVAVVPAAVGGFATLVGLVIAVVVAAFMALDAAAIRR